jgi:peptide/nickel transport system substrate-binding protein
MTSRNLLRTRSWPVVVGLCAIAIAACGSSSSPSTGPAVTKTTATFAESPGAQPNYIFPLASLAYFSVSNLSWFQYLLYRPLYWFGDNGQVQLNPSLSLADAPVYSSDGKSVIITLKGWKWSDGTQITARDIQFCRTWSPRTRMTGPATRLASTPTT